MIKKPDGKIIFQGNNLLVGSIQNHSINSGVIEFIDVQEEDQCMIAKIIKKLSKILMKHARLDINILIVKYIRHFRRSISISYSGS